MSLTPKPRSVSTRAPSTTLRVVPLPRFASATRGRILAGAGAPSSPAQRSGAGEGDRPKGGGGGTLHGSYP